MYAPTAAADKAARPVRARAKMSAIRPAVATTPPKFIDPVFLMAGRNYVARGLALLWHVILPAAMPVIFAGLRLALGTALIVIISVEFLRAKQGVGFMTFYYWEVMSPEKMYAGLVVVMILGVLLTYGLQWLQRRLMPWQR